MSLFRRALKVHHAALDRVAGELVTYSYAGETKEIRAVRGQSEFEDNLAEGDYHHSAKTIDWLIDADALGFEPKVGARITPAAGDGVFELVPGTNDEAWDWSDGRATRYRIHTIRIKEPT